MLYRLAVYRGKMIVSRELMRIFVSGLLNNIQKHLDSKYARKSFFDDLRGMFHFSILICYCAFGLNKLINEYF